MCRPFTIGTVCPGSSARAGSSSRRLLPRTAAPTLARLRALKNVRTEGLWIKCPGCRQPIFKADLEANLNVCPKCQHHFKIGARQRIDLLLEPGYELVDGGLRSTDPLNFTDVKPYKQRLRNAQEADRPRRRHPQRRRPARAP